jgi:membrane protein implicated in regulation of membrane protease activity
VVELIFLIFVLPRRMGRLARERNRSALWWSLAAICAWVGAELIIAVGFGLVYGTVGYLRRWPKDPPPPVVLVVYLVSLAAAVLGAEFVRRILHSMPRAGEFSSPPPPRF